jgi:hypothetical protein
MLRPGPGHQVDLTFHAVLLAPPRLSAPVDLVLVPEATSTSGPDARPGVVDLVGPAGLDALAAPVDATHHRDLALVRPGADVHDASSALEFADEVVRIAAGAGRPAESVIVDLGLDRAGDTDDALLRLRATARVAGRGHPVAVAVDGPAASPEAVVVAALALGARVLRLVPGGTGAREVRRAADVAEALLVERAGSGRPAVVAP